MYTSSRWPPATGAFRIFLECLFGWRRDASSLVVTVGAIGAWLTHPLGVPKMFSVAHGAVCGTKQRGICWRCGRVPSPACLEGKSCSGPGGFSPSRMGWETLRCCWHPQRWAGCHTWALQGWLCRQEHFPPCLLLGEDSDVKEMVTSLPLAPGAFRGVLTLGGLLRRCPEAPPSLSSSIPIQRLDKPQQKCTT